MDVAALPYKIGQLVNGEWKEFRHANKYFRDPKSKKGRIIIGAAEPFALISSLAQDLVEPVGILVVLHTPRSEEPGARYQSPWLTKPKVMEFLHKYRGAFDRDARADLWLYSPDTETQLVWEKHDLIFAYGELEKIEKNLENRGFTKGESELPFPHTHHYHAEFDLDFESMLTEFEWTASPLLPEDGD